MTNSSSPALKKPATPSAWLNELWRRGRFVGLITFLGTILFCLAHDRWTPAQWATPVHYDGDSLEVLARIKAAAEGDLAPLLPQRISRLEAPGEAIWNEYPGSDPWANFALGQLARITGVGAASNLALWMAHLSAVLVFYGCARFLGHRREWALGGALLFGFSYFGFNRGLPHLWLVFTWQVPLILLTCWIIGGGGRTLQNRGARWLCVGTALTVGASNPYHLFLYLQLLVWSLFAAWGRAEGGLNRRLGLGCLAAALGMFALTYLPVWLYAGDDGGLPLLMRNYAGTEIYGLKPIELMLPPTDHRSDLLGALGSRYVRWSDWRGETFSPYLGLIGMIALVWLFVELARHLAARHGPRPGAPGLQALWILMFSAIGGVNSILAFYFGLQVFRATNRYSIFLLALALFFLVARLSKLTGSWSPLARWGAAAGLLGLGLWDQIPRRATAEKLAVVAADFAADRALGEKIEAELHPGARVFQLPVMDFPEGSPRHRLMAYDHFRAYLGTETIRFSFGTRKGRAIGRWQQDFARLPPEELLTNLEQIGFDALLIDPRGYPDTEPIKALLAAAARRARTIDLGEDPRLLLKLQPAEAPRPPLAREPTLGQGWYTRRSWSEDDPSPRTFDSSARSPDSEARHRMQSGDEGSSQRLWGKMRDPSGGRVAHSNAVFKYYNPQAAPLTVNVALWLSAPDARKLELKHNKVVLAEINLDETPRALELEVILGPGLNRLDLITDRPGVRVSEQRWSVRAFTLHEMVWDLASLPLADLSDENPRVQPGEQAGVRMPRF